jgi:hypothetical protein
MDEHFPVFPDQQSNDKILFQDNHFLGGVVQLEAV